MVAQNVGIYVQTPFSIAKPTPAQQKEIAAAGSALGSSGFDTIVLASFHISATGDITYNDTMAATGGALSSDLDPNLATVLGNMKSKGTVKTILMSFGGGGCFKGQAIGYWDFLHLKNLIAKHPKPPENPFFHNLAALLRGYSINGVDIDLEVYADASLCPGGFVARYSEFTSTLKALASFMKANGGLTTIAPFDAYDFWADLLAETYVNGTQQIAWVNLQGGSLWPADNDRFERALQGKTIGVPNLDRFVLSGMQISTGDTPDQVQSAYAPFGQANPNAGGGWLWNFSFFKPDQSAAFAKAVRLGLQGISPS